MTSDSSEYQVGCPACDAGPKEVLEAGRNLTELGYLAEDVTHQCSRCGHCFARGEPVGDFDRADLVAETTCDACGGRGLVYQLHDAPERDVSARLKCEACHYVWVVDRDFENGGITFGYPSVMGRTDGANPWGYTDNVD